MINNRIFYKNGSYCQITRDIGESYENYMMRGNFIVSQRPQNKDQLEKIIILSRIWLNIKVHDNKYSNDIHKIINVMNQNL